MARSHAAGGAKSDYPAEPFDWYVEDGWCTDLLLQKEHFIGEIVDPACGMGTIPARAIAAGYDTSASDLVDRPRIADIPFKTLDFLGEEWATEDTVDNIACNPPFSYQKGIAAAFIRRALHVARRKVAVLLPNKFLSSQDRYLLFTQTPLRKVYYLMSRPSMPPGSLLVSGKVKRGGGKVDYCWLVFDHAHRGPATTDFLILPAHLAKQLKKQQEAA
ncbi:MAG: hypothetical protein K9G48_15425 [Reyranella sp.]|nr:hypothetical protein [Reyranella sp.]